MIIDHVSIIGAGYVGGCTAAVMAKNCNNIHFTVVDIDTDRINAWNSCDLPIYEPGLYEIVSRINKQNLTFTTDIESAIKKSQLVMLAVNTPTKSYGINNGTSYDLTAYENAAISIAKYAKSDLIVVEKSTVPVATADRILNIMNCNTKGEYKFTILSNPEFLAEGTAIHDLQNPDRVLIGGANDAADLLAGLYQQWVPADKIIKTNIWSAELSKIAANAFLAQRISSINSLSALCEVTGADIHQISKVIGADSRIGNKFLRASVGFGGSCFKKDLLGLIYLCEYYKLSEIAEYWRGVLKINDYQKSRFCEQIVNKMGSLRGKKISVLGYAFKKDTGDVRESPAIDIINFLLAEKAIVHVYDPQVSAIDIVRNTPGVIVEDNTEYITACKKYWYDHDKNLNIARQHIRSTITGASAVIILTNWEIFEEYKGSHMLYYMQTPAFVFDGVGIFNAENMIHYREFNTYSIGIKDHIHRQF